MKSHHQFTYHTAKKRPSKKNSFLILHDNATGAKYEFQEEKMLGSGTYGCVRLFRRTDRASDEKLAVKLPFIKNPMSKQDYLSIKNDVAREFKYLRKAYPQEMDFALKHFAQEKLNGEWEYTWRLIMPFFNGVKLDDYIQNEEHTTHDLANIFVGMLEALEDLHRKDIIHGDIAGRNIIVCCKQNELKFYFIDFGMAYSRRGKATTGFISTDNPDESLRMARERISEKVLKAHPSQDVCAMGKTILDALKDVPHFLRQKFAADYPLIMDFCEKAIDDDPDIRPDISNFLSLIKPMLNWRYNLSAVLQQLLGALNQSDSSSVRKILESNHKCNTVTLNDFLDQLITQREYFAAARLMSIKKRLIPSKLATEDACILDFYQFMLCQTKIEIIKACEEISDAIKRNDVDFNESTYVAIEVDDELNVIYNNLINNNIISDNNPRNQFYGW